MKAHGIVIAALSVLSLAVTAAPAVASVPSTSQVERIVERKLPSIGIRHHATVDYCEKVSKRKWTCEVSSRTLVGQTVIATYVNGSVRIRLQSLRDSVQPF